MRRAVLIFSGLVIAAFGAFTPALAGGAFGFGPPVYVSTTLAGGEPTVMQTRPGLIIYTAHEGTTHLYRPGLGAPTGDANWISNYRNQVNVWSSQDTGKTWSQVSWNGTGFTTNPAYTGFSDPDLTMGSDGTLYDTGIDLANDAVFSSTDGGLTWNQGTPNCNEGDRPWLAATDTPGTVYMVTDPEEPVNLSDETTNEGTYHQLFVSKDSGQSCSFVAQDYGQWTYTDSNGAQQTGSYTGYGKIVYNRTLHAIEEPVLYMASNGSSVLGLGVGIYKLGTSAFQDVFIAHTSLVGSFPSLSLDRSDAAYLVWTTDPRTADGGPATNEVMLATSKNGGTTWSAPRAIYKARAGERGIWAWATAGRPGALDAVWYEVQNVDVDGTATHFTYVYAAQTLDGGRHFSVVNAIPGVSIHSDSTICQSGTLCVATGQDRRLGDYFTDNLDSNGCLLIATGDTRQTDPSNGSPEPVSFPLFIHQNSGPSLTGGSCGTASNVEAVSKVAKLPFTGSAGPGAPWLPLAAIAAGLLLVLAGLRPALRSIRLR